jgi:hypothetical protein
MAGAYQAVVVVTTGFATRARMRMPERAASAQAKAVVNMGVREPHEVTCVNAITGERLAPQAGGGPRVGGRRMAGAGHVRR